MGETGDKEVAKAFSDYIKELRGKYNISAEALSEGLCGRRELSYLETGEREVRMLLQDALLERLGVGAENGEEYYDFEEYDRWEARQRILHNITFENLERAEELLTAYAQKYDLNDKLERQFYLSQLGQIRRLRGAKREELYEIYEEAVALTVSGVDERRIQDMVLSLKELNLILEREQYRPCGERVEWYAEILDYVENRKFDRIGRAKLFPKAVCFLYRSVKQNESQTIQEEWSTKRLLDCCERALEQLRNASRLYFMWEILEMREELLERRLEEVTRVSEGRQDISKSRRKEKFSLVQRKGETTQWKWALEAVYAEYEVPKETFEYCYLYVRKGVNCINDVIRIRRRMFGMNAKELREGICQEEVLRRLERRVSKPHRANVRDFFERLGLHGELKRIPVISSNPKVRRLMEEMNRAVNTLRIERAEELLTEIEKLDIGEYRVNKQALMQQQLVVLKRRNEISKDEYCQRIRNALQMTLPFEFFLSDGEKYLTNMEQTCIQNLMQGMDMESEEFKICIQRFEEYYASLVERELQDAVSSMYEHIMHCVGSKLGDMGEYDRADEHDLRIAVGCLRFRRMMVLPSALYGRWWNDNKRKEKGIPMKREFSDYEELTKCELLCRLAKMEQRAEFFLRKREQIEGLKE